MVIILLNLYKIEIIIYNKTIKKTLLKVVVFLDKIV